MDHHPASTHPPDHDMSNDTGMGHGMMMYFHTGNVATILFKEWKTDSVGELLGSVVAIFFLGIFYEALKFARDYLKRKNTRRGMLTPHHAIQSVLHFFQYVLSMVLMLIFMTYNVGLCLATAGGVTVGYFLFGWQRESIQDSNECCH